MKFQTYCDKHAILCFQAQERLYVVKVHAWKLNLMREKAYMKD